MFWCFSGERKKRRKPNIVTSTFRHSVIPEIARKTGESTVEGWRGISKSPIEQFVVPLSELAVIGVFHA